MHILITGASGFIGFNLTRKLAKKHHIRALVRKNSQVGALKKIKNVELAVGDLLDFPSLVKALEGIDVIYHLAAVLKPTPEKLLWEVNIEGTKNILKAAKLIKSIKHFIHCSSAYVSWGDKPWANEESECNPQTLYEKTKYEGEKIVAKLMGKVDFSITIIKPGFVYGPYTESLLPLFQTILKKRFFFVGNGNHLFELTYIDDLVNLFEKIMLNKKAFSQTFIISEKNPKIFAEVILQIMRLLQVKYSPVKIPKPFFKLLLEIVLVMKKVINLNIPISRDTYKTMAIDRAFDSSRAESILGYSPAVKMETGFKKLFEWYKCTNLLK